jgi:AraC-like DNA-binding protein
MPIRPICEPVILPPGATLRAERIRRPAHAHATEPFPHVHDVCEFVVFHDVAGSFIANGCRYPLSPGSIVYVPSMEVHDFTLDAGAKEWVLVQIDAISAEALARQPGCERLAYPFCARPDGVLGKRIADIANWLAGLDAADPLVSPLVKVLVTAIVHTPGIKGEPTTRRETGVDRLRPALDRLRRDPAHPATLEEAAQLCHLSPAYFSRQFKRTLGVTYGDYVRTHRLHLAARRLLESDITVAELAYDLGFSTPSHFTAVFGRRFGVSPRAYRLVSR